MIILKHRIEVDYFLEADLPGVLFFLIIFFEAFFKTPFGDLTIALPFMIFKRSSPLIVSYFKRASAIWCKYLTFDFRILFAFL